MREWSALFLHGAGGGGWEWRVWSGVWRAHGIDVYALDLQPVAAGLAATQWSDYQAQVMRALSGLPHPRVVIGASLGGLLAAQAAGAGDVLVLINPLPPAPWHAALPTRDWPSLVPWRRDARLAGTHGAMPGSDAAGVLYAFRRWRDESGAVLRAAHAGLTVEAPACPVLMMISAADADVPATASRALAQAWGAEVIEQPGGHVDPLLGRDAPACARLAVEWLNRRGGAM